MLGFPNTTLLEPKCNIGLLCSTEGRAGVFVKDASEANKNHISNEAITVRVLESNYKGATFHF